MRPIFKQLLCPQHGPVTPIEVGGKSVCPLCQPKQETPKPVDDGSAYRNQLLGK